MDDPLMNDYISLLETRFLLELKLPLVIKIVLDIFATLFISIAWFSMILLIIKMHNTAITLGDSFERIISLLLSDGRNAAVIQVALATTFVTSIWLWLHGLSRLIIQMLRPVVFVINWLNVKEKPLRAIGTTINVFVFLIGSALFSVSIFFI